MKLMESAVHGECLVKEIHAVEMQRCHRQLTVRLGGWFAAVTVTTGLIVRN